MSQPQTPTPPQPPSPEYRVQVGTGGVKVTQLGTDANAALAQQAQLLRTRIQSLTKEIESVKAEMNAPGAGPLIGSNQVRLTGLEGRRMDAEEALQRVEDQRAGIGDQQTIAEVGTPASLPGIPFDPNQSALQDKVAIISITAIICIGMPIAVAIARSIWKRTTARTLPSANADDPRRLERVEQAVDAIAIEMERMSEGQRYVTKLLAERADRIGESEAVPVSRVADDAARR